LNGGCGGKHSALIKAVSIIRRSESKLSSAGSSPRSNFALLLKKPTRDGLNLMVIQTPDQRVLFVFGVLLIGMIFWLVYDIFKNPPLP
jgi:hypothetical protein